MFFLPNIISGVMVSYVWYFIFTRAIPDVGKMLSNHFLSNIAGLEHRAGLLLQRQLSVSGRERVS